MRLEELIRQRRSEGGDSQAQVGRRLEMGQERFGRLERGDDRPGTDVLLRLFHELADDDASPRDLARWIAAWVETQFAPTTDKKTKQIRDPLSHDRELVDEAIRLLSEPMARRAREVLAQPKSLADFPFEPLAVVFGDRREAKPFDRSDLFAESASFIDATLLPQLTMRMNEPPSVWVDKVVMTTPAEQLADSHLLVIGSPAVNWLARMINSQAVFRFAIPERMRTWFDDYRAEAELDNRSLIDVFARLVATRERRDGKADAGVLERELSREQRETDFPTAARLLEKYLSRNGERFTEADIVHEFRHPGVLDPADMKVHGRDTGRQTDFGVVTLAPNPFDKSGRFLSVLCAGVHAPGTMHALKALLDEPERFADHPLGAVIEVKLLANDAWSRRIHNATREFQTAPYKVQDVLKHLEDATEQPPGEFASWANEFEAWKDFVRRFA